MTDKSDNWALNTREHDPPAEVTTQWFQNTKLTMLNKYGKFWICYIKDNFLGHSKGSVLLPRFEHLKLSKNGLDPHL